MKGWAVLLASITALVPLTSEAVEQEKLDPSNDQPTALSEPVNELGDPAPWIYPEFGITEAIITGTAITLTISSLFVPPREDAWQGGILFDEDVRDALRLERSNQRRVARDISDILLASLESYPFVVNALVIGAWYRDSPNSAVQMALINGETIAVTIALQRLLNVIANRERPYGQTCGSDLRSTSRDCDSDRRFHSFFSGHTSQAFACAGLICSHHMHLSLLGGGHEWVPCVTGYVLAGTTGMLRVVSDQHYLTDVLMGAAIGTLTGLLIPYLFHYQYDEPASDDGLAIQLVPTLNGAALQGQF